MLILGRHSRGGCFRRKVSHPVLRGAAEGMNFIRLSKSGHRYFWVRALSSSAQRAVPWKHVLMEDHWGTWGGSWLQASQPRRQTGCLLPQEWKPVCWDSPAKTPSQDEEWGYTAGFSRDDSVGMVLPSQEEWLHTSPHAQPPGQRQDHPPPSPGIGKDGSTAATFPTGEIVFTKGASITSEAKKPGKQGWTKLWRSLREVSAYTEEVRQ